MALGLRAEEAEANMGEFSSSSSSKAEDACDAAESDRLISDGVRSDLVRATSEECVECGERFADAEPFRSAALEEALCGGGDGEGVKAGGGCGRGDGGGNDAEECGEDAFLVCGDLELLASLKTSLTASASPSKAGTAAIGDLSPSDMLLLYYVRGR